MLQWVAVAVLVTAAVLLLPADSCNEAVCASVVSKCMLTQSCKCDLKNCSCCKECFSCLNHLYSECCSCVDMCPKLNDTGSGLSKTSHVEDFTDFLPSLFAALTSEPDPQQRWLTITFPMDIDMTYQSRPDKEMKYRTQSSDQVVTSMKNITQNCTVVYMNQCTTWKKCRSSCESMGSNSYRWFHDGCCECIGPHCINYGIDDSRCEDCPMSSKEEEEDEDEDAANYDYNGEDAYYHSEQLSDV